MVYIGVKMNDRIKEFAGQAGYKHPDAVGMCEDYAYFSHEKFAELIILECDKFVTTNFHDSGMTLGAKMKKHFGVNDES